LRRPILLALAAPASRSNPARERHGIPIRSGRRWSSRPVSAGLKNGADLSRKSARAMSSGFEPNEKHWHAASPAVAMTHIAIQEALNGKVVDWLEKVSDEQYNGQRT